MRGLRQLPQGQTHGLCSQPDGQAEAEARHPTVSIAVRNLHNSEAPLVGAGRVALAPARRHTCGVRLTNLVVAGIALGVARVAPAVAAPLLGTTGVEAALPPAVFSVAIAVAAILPLGSAGRAAPPFTRGVAVAVAGALCDAVGNRAEARSLVPQFAARARTLRLSPALAVGAAVATPPLRSGSSVAALPHAPRVHGGWSLLRSRASEKHKHGGNQDHRYDSNLHHNLL